MKNWHDSLLKRKAVNYKENKENLIKEFARHGIPITETDVQEVLRIGADTWLGNNGTTIREKELTQIHIILTELREGSIPRMTTKKLTSD